MLSGAVCGHLIILSGNLQEQFLKVNQENQSQMFHAGLDKHFHQDPLLRTDCPVLDCEPRSRLWRGSGAVRFIGEVQLGRLMFKTQHGKVKETPSFGKMTVISNGQ